jgi:hypothetical protein
LPAFKSVLPLETWCKGVSRNVFDSMVAVAHAYRKNTHKTANKAYRFLNFMIPPVKPVSIMNLSGSEIKHLCLIKNLHYKIFIVFQ